MTLSLVGLNQSRAAVELRERFAVPLRELPDALSILRAGSGVEEAVILSTCNRIELYVAAPDAAAPVHELVDFLAFRSRLRPEQFQRLLYTLTDTQAAAHLFRVAAGLESMILGESEVTAQVKQAYLTANAAGATGTVLNRLFQKALHSAKIVRSRTKITEGQTSIGSVVVRLARQFFGESLQGRRALLWGAGKAAAATTRHLVASQIGELWIVNRTQAKAEDLASLCKGQWMAWEEAQRRLAEVDIAVVCTQAPHYVIDRADVEAVLPLRGARPLFLVDLAVPRNVDPTLREESGVRLYNIDDLQSIAHTGLAARRQELASCLVLIDEQVGHFQRRRNTHPSTEGWQASPSATTPRLGPRPWPGAPRAATALSPRPEPGPRPSRGTHS